MFFLGVFFWLLAWAPALLLASTTTQAVAASQQSPQEQALHLLQQHNPYPDSQLHITLDPQKKQALEHCDALQLSLPQQTGLRTKITLRATCQAPRQWVRYIQADLRIEGDYPVAARTLAPGTSLDESLLTTQKGDLLRLGNGSAHKKDELMGYITTQRILKNSPIKMTALRAPDSILRGQNVQLVFKGPGFSITSDGIAQKNANPGSLLTVRARSGKIITGYVLDSSTVEIRH